MPREWIHGQCVGCPVPAECRERCPDLLEDLSGLAFGWLPGARIPDRPADLAPFLEHSLVLPEVTRTAVVRVCADASRLGLGAVCVNPTWIDAAASELRGTKTRVVAMVDFPLGSATAAAKAFAAREAFEKGASEVTVVLNIGRLRSGDEDAARDGIRDVMAALVEGVRVTVVLETACLTLEEKIRACRMAAEAGAQAVETSTGFGPDGANLKDVSILRRALGNGVGVKATGGIRDAAAARAMLLAGASRIGTPAGGKIVRP